MATNAPTTYTPPSAATLTELYYATEAAGTEMKQIFGVQSIPPVITAKEDITYRTLESATEFAVKGVRPYETIEVECMLYKEQYAEIKTLSDGDKELWWFVKLPDTQKMVLKWRGSVDISISEIALDDMLKTVIKIGKSTDPEVLEKLPTVTL